ncbi:hypothetical protein XENOCAPTIV_016547 [Xenoophorus captivus]|uniref:Uncharacterized protein n=1 Tax=Xenoophorus captivus TaxID=1517983 RepID=A0ABV0R953_9TELE
MIFKVFCLYINNCKKRLVSTYLCSCSLTSYASVKVITNQSLSLHHGNILCAINSMQRWIRALLKHPQNVNIEGEFPRYESVKIYRGWLNIPKSSCCFDGSGCTYTAAFLK